MTAASTGQILIVEDNPYNLELMTYLLTASGHEVRSAMTGADGLAVIAAAHPDLVVLDLQLPDMDGYEVLERIRTRGDVADLPVVAVTAYAMVGDRDLALAAGFDGYISKPIDPTTFVRDVIAHLPAPLRGHTPIRQWAHASPDAGTEG